MKGLSVIADYFVICSGESSRQVRALAEEIEKKLSKSKILPLNIEGLNNACWILMDYGDVIVHIFDAETRAYYELEKLWLDAPRIPVNQDKDILGKRGKRALY